MASSGSVIADISSLGLALAQGNASKEEISRLWNIFEEKHDSAGGNPNFYSLLISLQK